ncbi:MAG: hypothetical protein LBK63_02420 [Treponema sp.]|jgi:hypothetical protein|nr:hypothetical protein [Treponema sp.]
MMDLSARPAFNSAVRHIKKALELLEALEGGENFADALRRPPHDGLSGAASLSILNLLLVDKLGYTALSANPPAFAADLPELAGEFKKWEAVDVVAVFHDPRLPIILNPKNAEQLAALGKPFPRELLVVYAGGVSGELGAKAARAAIALLSGGAADIPAELVVPARLAVRSPLKAAPKKALRRSDPEPERTTPLYSVRVTNDLFHNGNVEAWKRVIQKYEKKRPGLKVRVYYGGEPVLNLNTLFAWGKVKSGGVIQFSVFSPGGAVPGMARLRRLLAQASSRDFEPLLGGSDGGRPALF